MAVSKKTGQVFNNFSLGGPVNVYVKNGKISRMEPLEAAPNNAKIRTIEARGKEFTSGEKVGFSPFGFSEKDKIYSPQRVLYPVKRVGFDPNVERNWQSMGISGYEYINYDEAPNIVTKEMKGQPNARLGPNVI